jgi:hypothetical protein
VIKNIKIGPSPMWMRKALNAAGVRAINNIVDYPVSRRIVNGNLRQLGRFNLLFANENPHFEFQINPSFL